MTKHFSRFELLFYPGDSTFSFLIGWFAFITNKFLIFWIHICHYVVAFHCGIMFVYVFSIWKLQNIHIHTYVYKHIRTPDTYTHV